ncbi:unnamed protein product [Heligmosomoides polygyrus]|uniref:DUF1758 domain-containing protein n=1 Tax=Heligmosomoides polygyrus TaxID=6339 RepID=A0A183G466_HELPZ|nr:unnamed protein product [Heligmosomoides polygyrus]
MKFHGKSKPFPSKKPSTTSAPSKTTMKMNTVTSDQHIVEVHDTNAVFHVNKAKDVLILVGQAQVLNPITQALEPAHVMLDTGAERWFITDGLASRLQLKDESSGQLRITTFTSKTPIVKSCGITTLRIWDASGAPHSFTVTRIDTLTETMQRSSLSSEDKRFLCDHDLQLSINAFSKDICLEILQG